MKAIKSILVIVLLACAASFAQPFMPPERNSGGLINNLKLNDGQKAKLDKILVHQKEQFKNLHDKIAAIMKALRDSTAEIKEQTDKDILSILDKEQSEKFKSELEHHNDPADMPPPEFAGSGFPPMAPGSVNCPERMRPENPCQSGMPGIRRQLPDEANNPGPVPGPEINRPHAPNDEDMDMLQDLDIFDLMSILE